MQVYRYLDSLKGSAKGLIGEILFKNSEENIFCTKLCTPKKIEKLPFEVPIEIKKFLYSNWHSLDCFSFKTIRDACSRLFYKQTILYEVKTKRYNPNQEKSFQKISFTDHEIEVYEDAQSLGIEVKIVKIIFFDNWKYLIRKYDFDSKKYKYKICNGTNWKWKYKRV